MRKATKRNNTLCMYLRLGRLLATYGLDMTFLGTIRESETCPIGQLEGIIQGSTINYQMDSLSKTRERKRY